MILDVIALALLVLLSGFFSSSELAFVVSNKIKIEIAARKENFSAKSVLYYIKNPHIFFSTILIGNNIVNIAFASVFTVFLYNVFRLNDFSILIISTSILLLFGELIPKYFAREFADRFVILSAIPVRLFTFLLYPLVKFTSSLTAFVTSIQETDNQEAVQVFEKEDIHDLIDESSEAGKVAEEESDVIKKIIDLGEQKIYESMTPRIDIVGVEIDSTIEKVIETFIESGFSKLPVYGESLDDIKGVVYAYDMFKFPKDLKTVMKPVEFVPETKKTLEMLNEFLEKRISIAIVVDEFGGTAGLITIEDIVEEMFGEIQDEYDVDEEVCKQIDDKTYVVSGKVEIDRLSEEFGLEIPEGDYETIAGYIITRLGRIPVKGEQIRIDDLDILILHSTKTKINLLKIFVNKNKNS